MTLVNDRSGAAKATQSSVLPVLLVGLVGLGVVLLLGWSNLGLRGDLARQERTLHSLEETITWNLRLSTLEGAPLAAPLAELLRPDLSSEDPPGARTLLMVYTPSVCLTCLRAGFESIKNGRAQLESAGIVPHALIGERLRTRESALLMREDGLLAFPMTFVPADTVLESLPFGGEVDFSETPLYLLLDRDLVITSVFRADSQRPELLDRWLAARWSPER